jgi:hypothetical protein
MIATEIRPGLPMETETQQVTVIIPMEILQQLLTLSGLRVLLTITQGTGFLTLMPTEIQAIILMIN